MVNAATQTVAAAVNATPGVTWIIEASSQCSVSGHYTISGYCNDLVADCIDLCHSAVHRWERCVYPHLLDPVGATLVAVLLLVLMWIVASLTAGF